MYIGAHISTQVKRCVCAPLTPDTRMVSVTLKLRQYFTCQYDCSVTDVVVFVLVKDILVYFPKLVIVVYSMKHCKENSIKMLKQYFLNSTQLYPQYANANGRSTLGLSRQCYIVQLFTVCGLVGAASNTVKYPVVM